MVGGTMESARTHWWGEVANVPLVPNHASRVVGLHASVPDAECFILAGADRSSGTPLGLGRGLLVSISRSMA